MSEFATVVVSTANRDEAKSIARALVEKRLAACVQIVPIDSVYWWQDSIEEAQEYLLIGKSRAADFSDIEATVRSLHSYDVPEILSLPILAGSKPYLAWMCESLKREHKAAASKSTK